MAAKRKRVDFAPRPLMQVRWVEGRSLVFSSMLSGPDDESPSYELPKEVERGVEIPFRHIREFVERRKTL